MINSGLSVGAGLVFLMAGPVTNMATIGTVYKVLGKKVVFIYVFSVTFIELIFGYWFDENNFGTTIISESKNPLYFLL